MPRRRPAPTQPSPSASPPRPPPRLNPLQVRPSAAAVDRGSRRRECLRLAGAIGADVCVCVCVCVPVSRPAAARILSICTCTCARTCTCKALSVCARVRLQAQIGAMAGIVAATSCFPFEVVRRRQMGGELTSLSVIGAMCAQRAQRWPGSQQPVRLPAAPRVPPACSGRPSAPGSSALAA